METRRRQAPLTHHELRAKRMELHGRRRELHDKLTEVCEDFAVLPLGKAYKRNTLVRVLTYIRDYYRDEENWEGIE